MTQHIYLAVKCPNCNESLMTDKVMIDDHPAIELEAKMGDRLGKIYLSPEYGSYNKKFETVENIVGSIAVFSCLHCHQPLPVIQLCDCKAPLVGMQLQVGGMIKICSRNGCKRHSLEFEDINDAMNLLLQQDETGLG
ncbi:MAG: hypothetical protein Kow0042_20600 [Calditrichia bacterium]